MDFRSLDLAFISYNLKVIEFFTICKLHYLCILGFHQSLKAQSYKSQDLVLSTNPETVYTALLVRNCRFTTLFRLDLKSLQMQLMDPIR